MTDPHQLNPEAPADTAITTAPSDTAGTVSLLSADTAGQRYQMLTEIAHGGMGVIWRANDTALGREVAIKVLRETCDPDSATARRFATETRITAQLQHPAIPPVHDGGKLADGRPFLAMKLIKGCTLDELLRQRGDPSAERGRFLAVFEQVCQAVAYAHAHGVIHRDLKPGNVMVGGFGEVQVMDWGLAKVLSEAVVRAPVNGDSGDTGETVAATLIRGSDADGSDGSCTQAGSILGTLAYMPPEQAAGEVGKVDQRSDVFGLGAILAVILTGRPPYTGGDADAVRVMAIRGDLTACLARLDGSGAEPELVALCKRCLAFASADRPRDAGAVAEEIAALRAAAEERARAAETERAAAEARAVEQRRKRRWQLAAAGMVVLALLAGLGGLSLFLRTQAQANANLKAANQREHERFELALDAIKTFHTGVSEDVLLKEEEFKGPRERLLREAVRFYGKLREMLEGQSDASSQRALAESYFLLAELTGKIGSFDESLALHRQALELRRHLAARGEVGAELEVARSLLALASCFTNLSDAPKAWAPADEARELAEAAGPSDEALTVLADSHARLGHLSWGIYEWKESLRHAERSLEIRRKLAEGNSSDASLRQKLAEDYNSLGIALKNLKRDREALQAYQASIEIYEKEARANPGDAILWDWLAKTHNNKGILLQRRMDKPEEAASEFATAIKIEQQAINANPAVSTYKNNRAFFCKNRGDVLKNLGRAEEALRSYQQAVKILQPLADAGRGTLGVAANLARSYAAIGSVLVVLDKPREALPEFNKAVLIYRKKANPQSAWWLPEVAFIARNQGMALQKLGRHKEAVGAYRESITLLEKLKKPQSFDIYCIAYSHALLHGIASEKGSGLTSADAEAAAERALATFRRAAAAGYRDVDEMRKDAYLDALRKRPDFEKLVADLDKDSKATDE